MAGNPADIANRIANGSQADVSGALPPVDTGDGVGVGGGGEASPALGPESINRLLDEKLGPLQEKISELTQENAFLRGSWQSSQQTTQAAAQAAQSAAAAAARISTPVAPAPGRFHETTPEAEIVEGLRSNPVATLGRYVDSVLEAKLGPVLERIDQVGQRFNQSQAETQFRTNAQQDISRLTEDFGYLKDNAEFARAADQEFNSSIATRGSYSPGMMYEAADRVFKKMLREGRIEPPGVHHTNGSVISPTNPQSIARTLRDQNSHGAESSLGARGGSDMGGSGGDPQSIDDLISRGFLTATDKAAAQKIMTRYGVSEKQYVANYWADKKSNPRFGERS